jgi:hypothetical protein
MHKMSKQGKKRQTTNQSKGDTRPYLSNKAANGHSHHARAECEHDSISFVGHVSRDYIVPRRCKRSIILSIIVAE